MDRPITTLFLITSLDGKISTGDTDQLDVDRDFTDIVGVREGLQQYYDLEKQTDLVSFGTAKVQAKIGANSKDLSKVKKDDVSFVMVDNQLHFDKNGVEYFAKKSKFLYLVTTNKNHPVFELKNQYDNIEILYYEESIDFTDVFRQLKEKYKIPKVTIQSGGTLNAVLLREGLIDHVSIVITPCLIGGKDTPSLISGESLHSLKDLHKIKALKLIENKTLQNSYIYVRYEVINNTKIND